MKRKNRMKMHRILAGIIMVACAILMLGTVATAQEMSVDPQVFRSRMVDWALASQPSGELAEKIKGLSDEQIMRWSSTIEDPHEFLRSLEGVTERLTISPELQVPSTTDEEAQSLKSSLSSTTLTTPFPPDYPPGTGAYKDVIIDAIAGFGIGGATNTNRCLAADWGDFIGVWWPLNKGIDTLDGACVVAGCDPIGLVCAGVCGTLEIAKVALKVAAIPLEACDVHQGAIDGAEIEATYENTLGLVGDVSHVHGDLATHDTDVKSQLTTHDTAIKAHVTTHDTAIKALLATLQAGVDANGAKLDILLARQLETIRLLHTPQGLRTSAEPACNGGPCDFPEPKQ